MQTSTSTTHNNIIIDLRFKFNQTTKLPEYANNSAVMLGFNFMLNDNGENKLWVVTGWNFHKHLIYISRNDNHKTIYTGA